MIEGHGKVWVHRGDLDAVHGVCGGKALACSRIVEEAIARRPSGIQGVAGLITAGAKSSPQVNIVAHIAQALGLPCVAHVPQGALRNLEIVEAQAVGAQIVEHFPGYNTVIVARAREMAEARPEWIHVPFGMDSPAAIRMTADQVPAVLPEGVQRIVVPVGSGMSLIGVMYGLIQRGHRIPVHGVIVGANPKARLFKYREFHSPRAFGLTLGTAPIPYGTRSPEEDIRFFSGFDLDPYYESKCVHALLPGDLFWVVGKRNAA